MPGIHSGPLTRLIYISRSTLARDDVMPGLRAISATATARNADLRVTGALLHTGSHFAQVIEGAAAAIDLLMAAIRADTRHEGLQVIAHGPVAARQFSAWMTVYNGHAGYVQRFLDSCLAHPGSPGEQAKLLRLFREFSRDLLEAG
jgi:hypothetical protein